MHLVFFYYERFLFLQKRQYFHKRFDFVFKLVAATFLKKYTQKQENFNGFKSERICLNAFKMRIKTTLQRVHTFF